jgi:hypothetical protein
MKIKNLQIQILHNVLCRLEPLDKPAFVFSGKVRYNIARNIKLLSQVVSDIENMRIKLVTEKLKPGESELTGTSRIDFLRDFNGVLETETDIDLIIMKISDLDLDKNQIQVGLLSELVDVLFIQ